MAVPKGTKPDYRLNALNKATEETNLVGAAWINDSGRISIKLNAFVKLEASKDLVLTLFPMDDRDKARPHPASPSDDDVPF